MSVLELFQGQITYKAKDGRDILLGGGPNRRRVTHRNGGATSGTQSLIPGTPCDFSGKVMLTLCGG